MNIYQEIADQIATDDRRSAEEINLHKRQRFLVGSMSASLQTLCDLWIDDARKRTNTYNALNSFMLCAVEIVAGWKVRTK